MRRRGEGKEGRGAQRGWWAERTCWRPVPAGARRPENYGGAVCECQGAGRIAARVRGESCWRWRSSGCGHGSVGENEGKESSLRALCWVARVGIAVTEEGDGAGVGRKSVNRSGCP